MSKGHYSKLFKKACLNKCLRELFAVGGGEGCFGYGRLPFFWGMPVNRHSQLYDIVYKYTISEKLCLSHFGGHVFKFSV